MTTGAIKTLDDLHSFLYRALQLEHATIPPYLTALYSIRPGTNLPAAQALRTVAVEEMLHLSIVANLMNATGGTVDLTKSDFVPLYPAYLPDGEDHFQVGLGPFSPDAIDTFLKIEQPAMAPAGKAKLSTRYALARTPRQGTILGMSPVEPGIHYYSIGEFYAEIERGLLYLADDMGSDLFVPERAPWQVTSDYYYSGGGQLFPITGLATAQAALRLIVEQGEGAGGGIYDHEHELAHYFRFMELKKGRYYEKGNDEDNPTGPLLNIDWQAAYPLVTNARLTDYKDEELRAAAAGFNDYYGEYLVKLTRAFNGHPELLLDAVPMMFEIRNRMVQLMRVPLNDGSGLNAAPTFEIRPKVQS